MKNRGTVPKIGTLMEILDGLDIPICDFFVADTRPKKDGYLTVEEMDLVEVNRTLNNRKVTNKIVDKRFATKKAGTDEKISRKKDCLEG